MTRMLLLAALALACVSSPVFAMAYPPGQGGAAVGLSRSLLFLAALALSVALALATRRFGVIGIIGAALAALVLSAEGAFAAEIGAVGDTAVILPYGEWITVIAQTATEILIPITVAALGIAARKLPWLVSMYLTEARIDRMVRLAADYALNAVEKAAADKILSVDVGYTVLKVRLERAIGSPRAGSSIRPAVRRASPSACSAPSASTRA
ncbi:hypothetical protein ASF56_20600 [Methylobacterium sp. Leaf122]|uniref:Uncharacterized protein n=2 Tax=Methylorubrum extorquens TaxID=408 RepID=A0AAX3WM15_METEX|nr:hypothetical protein ASF33_16965 [Methylobacterium sp. Leaf92]KQQ20316.1 hypothetical protein ASF56_20600 [Methylobacterium sp. Leaf122]WHQ72600.1 hypothetical protein KEC54_01515 [Methylorubrum extorquens]